MFRSCAFALAVISTQGLGACAGEPDFAQTANESSILASSIPASGAVVRTPPESLELHFSLPAQLDEVKIAGPQGTMPMMIHSAGEVADYDLPLSGMSAGSYRVEWTAKARGREYSGSFSFAVRP